MAATVASSAASSDRRWQFRVPQIAAALLLLVFAGQGLWLVTQIPVSQGEMMYARPAAMNMESSAANSPVTTLLARLFSPSAGSPVWPARLLFVWAGVLLGASLWYVARRLYGNTGGYIALMLYAFSPTMISYSARINPQIVAAWSFFGCIFTSIAVAHTLYAPREVFFWNRKRIALLGTAIGLGAGAQFSTVLAIVLGLAFMLFLVPERRPAALAIMAAASALGLVILWMVNRFSITLLQVEVGRSSISRPVLSMLFSAAAWRMMAILILRNGPGLMLLLLIAVGAVIVWPRTRFFGTLAPLLVALVLIASGLVFPAAGGFSFWVIALPFLFVFAAGVWTDLLQSRRAPMALGILVATLVGQAYFSLEGLWRMR
jgi:hypothetical protein